ncbi:MAG TPA: hypothetical protein VFE62_29440 [Gemmataceae bacterium]|nr:hypothetical protein [Gemmataceae bacterium]
MFGDQGGRLFSDAAYRFSVLLSALPVKQRAVARAELVGCVASLQLAQPVPPSLFHPDSVVGKEIKQIAVLLVNDVGPTLVSMPAWGLFSLLVGESLRGIEDDATKQIAKMKMATG